MIDSQTLLENPTAKLYGEPLLELPQDLYIPPKALSVLLSAFEGPLDLLLYLIRKSNIDILDIPMASLTAQYLHYIEAIDEHFELAADYLAMAAYLIEIKSRLLLPRPPAVLEEEAEDPRAELVKRLVEYEAMKKNAEAINALPRNCRDFFVPKIDFAKPSAQFFFTFMDFQAAWENVLKRQKLNAAHWVEKEVWSVRLHMQKILKTLENQSNVVFLSLVQDSNPIALVVHFVAMLELAKEHLLNIEQSAPFAPIVLSRA